MQLDPRKEEDLLHSSLTYQYAPPPLEIMMQKSSSMDALEEEEQDLRSSDDDDNDAEMHPPAAKRPRLDVALTTRSNRALNLRRRDDERVAVQQSLQALESLETQLYRNERRKSHVGVFDLVQQYEAAAFPLSLAEYSQLDPYFLIKILHPGTNELFASRSPTHRLLSAMTYINKHARVFFNQSSGSKVVMYKTIHPQKGIVVLNRILPNSFEEMFPVLAAGVKFPCRLHKLARIKEKERRLFGTKVRRSFVVRNYIEEYDPKQGREAEIDGWYINPIAVWLRRPWAYTLNSVVFNPAPTSIQGSATNDQVNTFIGIHSSEQRCLKAFNETRTFHECDFPADLARWFLRQRVDGQPVVEGGNYYLWRLGIRYWDEFVLRVICNENQEVYEFMLLWWAHILRKPWMRTQRAMVMVGPEGVGKSKFLEAMKRLIGLLYCYATTAAGDAFGDFNGGIKGRLLVCLEEAASDKKEASKITPAFKRMVTDDQVRLRPMYVPAEDMQNYLNIVAQSNFEEAVPWTFRRIVAVKTSPHVWSPDFYTAVHYLVKNNESPLDTHPIIEAWAYQKLYAAIPQEQIDGFYGLQTPQTKLYLRLLIQNCVGMHRLLFDHLKRGVSCDTLDMTQQALCMRRQQMKHEESQAFLRQLALDYYWMTFVHYGGPTCALEGCKYTSIPCHPHEFWSIRVHHDQQCKFRVVECKNCRIEFNPEWHQRYIGTRSDYQLSKDRGPLNVSTDPLTCASAARDKIRFRPMFGDASQPGLVTGWAPINSTDLLESLTWRDAAYYYHFLLDLEQEYPDWIRLVTIKELMSKKDVRFNITDAECLQEIKTQLSSDGRRSNTMPIQVEEETVRINESQVIRCLRLPNLVEARMAWAERHWTTTQVFSVDKF